MMRALQILGFLLAAALVLGSAAGLWIWHDRPRLDALSLEPLATAPAKPARGELRVTFAGVATLLFSDGETAVMTDGFFSRPGLMQLVRGRVAPHEEAIARGLERLGVGRAETGPLAAVVPVHSHYDHAMDSPRVAQRTGAVLLGSASSAQIARGLGLPEERIRVAEPGRPYRFGAFRITLIPSRHVRYPWNEDGAGLLGTAIEAPLVPPAAPTAYKEGVTWSVLVQHPRATVLVQGSAGFVPGALEAYQADVVMLGIGALGHHPPGYRAAYYDEVVRAVGARLVLPIHFTDFTRPLDAEPRPFPRHLDPVEESLVTLRQLVDAEPQVRLARLPFWEPVRLSPSH